jgi:protein-L-isoaspartate O-methyltransferase
MREQLREGVKVVSAPQLFPTPAAIAARMVEEAAIEAGHSILEPSAGTGRILQAVAAQCDRDAIQITAIEINRGLSSTLAACFGDVKTRCADFLECDTEIGKFDRILMNPPFANGQDIAHIAHALDFLKPGGRLVAICADGSRQREKLLPLVEATGGTWESLPAGTFTESGTGVSTALITIEG